MDLVVQKASVTFHTKTFKQKVMSANRRHSRTRTHVMVCVHRIADNTPVVYVISVDVYHRNVYTGDGIV